jgi:hypothetical protein
MITPLLKDLVVRDLKFGSILKVIWPIWEGGGGHIADSCLIIEEDVRKQFISTMKKQPLEGSFVFDPQVCHE